MGLIPEFGIDADDQLQGEPGHIGMSDESTA